MCSSLPHCRYPTADRMASLGPLSLALACQYRGLLGERFAQPEQYVILDLYFPKLHYHPNLLPS